VTTTVVGLSAVTTVGSEHLRGGGVVGDLRQLNARAALSEGGQSTLEELGLKSEFFTQAVDELGVRSRSSTGRPMASRLSARDCNLLAYWATGRSPRGVLWKALLRKRYREV
jgi:hypothetical protein